ncbi:hypothetical protein N8996_00585 [Candidatus Poseidonia alphae]|nr:hypothetical protein [Candidatus Poseidonia alphae]
MIIEGGQFLCQVDGGHKRLRPPALLWFISQSNGTLVIAFDYEDTHQNYPLSLNPILSG